MGSDRRLGNPKELRALGHATDLNDGKKNPQFRWRQLKLLGDGYWRGGQIERRLANEHRRYRAVANASLAPRSGGEGQDMGDVAFVVARPLMAPRRPACRARH